MKINAPNIHLLAYKLYKAVNLDAAISTEDVFLWQSADNIIKSTLNQDLHLSKRIDLQKEPENTRVELIKDSEVIDGDYSISIQGNLSQIAIKGFAYPLRIYDSYGLWLNLRRPEYKNDDTATESLDTSVFSKFNHNNCFTLPQHPLLLGQTLLITGYAPSTDKDEKSIAQIATECLSATFPDEKIRPPFNRQGELFGSPIFEYGLFSQPKKYQHVLIWIFRNDEADEKLNDCYQDLLDLFFFRIKVIKAYQNSLEIYSQLDNLYKEIETNINKISKQDESVTNINKISKQDESVTAEKLKHLNQQLKGSLQLSFEYTKRLRDLEDYQNTIAIHTYNYKEKLRKISALVGENDIPFLENFIKETSPYFQERIKAYLGYFRQGTILLEQAISSIRGIVEIEQAERDRSLEQTVQILGIGFGGGAIISGVIVQHIDKIKNPLAPISFDKPFHPFYASLLLSIVATLIFITIGIKITKRK